MERDDAGLAVALAADERGALQHVEMLADRSQRHRVRSGQLAHRKLLLRDSVQQRSPRAIGQGMEDEVEGLITLFNHVVEYTHGATFCQPCG